MGQEGKSYEIIVINKYDYFGCVPSWVGGGQRLNRMGTLV